MSVIKSMRYVDCNIEVLHSSLLLTHHTSFVTHPSSTCLPSVVDHNGDPNRFAKSDSITMATPKPSSSRILMLAACWAALSTTTTTTTTTTLAWAPQRGPFRSPAVSSVATHLSSTTAPASASAEGTTVATTTTAMRGQNLEHEHCRSPGDRDILVRAARGEQTERTPVWLMR
jgi:hypothetical protein